MTFIDEFRMNFSQLVFHFLLKTCLRNVSSSLLLNGWKQFDQIVYCHQSIVLVRVWTECLIELLQCKFDCLSSILHQLLLELRHDNLLVRLESVEPIHDLLQVLHLLFESVNSLLLFFGTLTFQIPFKVNKLVVQHIFHFLDDYIFYWLELA